jgi:hypothetical protein
MLEKTPNSEPARANANAVPAADYHAFLVKRGELFINKQFVIDLAKRAKVRSSRISKFNVSEILTNWLLFASGKINQSAMVEVLNEVIAPANVLHRVLQSLEDERRGRLSSKTRWRRRVSTHRGRSWQTISKRGSTPMTVKEVQDMLRPLKKEDVLFSIRVGLQLLPRQHGLDCKVDMPGLLSRLSDLLTAAKDMRRATTGAGTSAPRKARKKGGRGAPLGSRGLSRSKLACFLSSAQCACGWGKIYCQQARPEGFAPRRPRFAESSSPGLP